MDRGQNTVKQDGSASRSTLGDATGEVTLVTDTINLGTNESNLRQEIDLATYTTTAGRNNAFLEVRDRLHAPEMFDSSWQGGIGTSFDKITVRITLKDVIL